MSTRDSIIVLFIGLLAWGGSAAPAQIAELVKDVEAGRDEEGAPIDTAAVFETDVLAERVFFRTDFSSEIWQSNGTVAGTAPLLDGFFVGVTDSSAYFSALVDEQGSQGLWRLDAQTGQLVLSDSGVLPENPGTAFRSRLAFAARRSTVTGPEAVLTFIDSEDQATEIPVPGAQRIQRLHAGATVLYLDATLGDGTDALFALRSLQGTPERVYSYRGSLSDTAVEVVEDRAYVFDGFPSLTLSTTVGTLASTRLLTDFESSFARLFEEGPAASSSEAGVVFQISANGVWEAWATDGTPAGTRKLDEGAPFAGPYFAEAHSTGFITVSGELLKLFDADGRSSGPSVEVSEALGVTGNRVIYAAATSPGSAPELHSLHLQTGQETALRARPLQVGGFLNVGPTSVGLVLRIGQETWLSDGTEAGTRRILPALSGFEALPPQVLETSTHLFLNRFSSAYSWSKSAQRAIHLAEFLPRPLENSGAVVSSPRGTTVFLRTAGSGEIEYTVSDGTQAGTRRLPLPRGCSDTFQDAWFVRGNELITPCGDGSLLARRAGGGSSRRIQFTGLLPFSTTLRFVDLERGTVVLPSEGGSSGCMLFLTDGTDAGSGCAIDLGLTNAFVSPASTTDGLVRLLLCQGQPSSCELIETDGETVSSLADGFTGFPLTGVVESSGRLHWILSDFSTVSHVSVDLGGGAPRALALDTEATFGQVYELATAGQNLVLAGPVNVLPGGAQRGLFTLDPSGRDLPTSISPPSALGSIQNLTPLGEALIFGAGEPWITEGTVSTTRQLRDIVPGSEGSGPEDFFVVDSQAYFTAFTPELGRELWRTDGTTAGTRLVQDLFPGPNSSRPRQFSGTADRLFFLADDGLHGRELHSLRPRGDGCESSGLSHCLNGGRFRVEMTWRDFQNNEGRGRRLPVSDDTGGFWFFDPDNVEAMIKVLDGTGVNGFHWVFSGSLSNVAYTITVTDSETGQTKRYYNPSGNFGSRGDTRALSDRSATVPNETLAPSRSRLEVRTSQVAAGGSCVTTSQELCLAGRFSARVTWRDFQGNEGTGRALPFTEDTGNFWFFDRENIELTVKALDARGVNGNFWIFFGALSNVAYELRVTDTVTGAVRTYSNPLGRFASIGDTAAFPGQ